MTRRRLSRLTLWWNAWRDRRHDLPAPAATGLSDTERRVQAAVNLTVRDLHAGYSRLAEPPKARLAAACNELETRSRPEFDRLALKAGRLQERVHLSGGAHWFLMSILSIGEAAFNLVVFGVFGENLLLTVLMALGVAFAIPLIAFQTGVALRQYEGARRVRWVVGGTALAAITLAGINWVRVTYLVASGADPSTTSRGLPIAYLLVNLVIFAAAVVVTYLSKDPEEGFMKAKTSMERLESEIAVLRGRLHELGEGLLHDIEAAHEAGHQAVAYYRTVNRRGRAAVPAYFDDEGAPNHRVTFATVSVPRFDQPALQEPPLVEPYGAEPQDRGNA